MDLNHVTPDLLPCLITAATLSDGDGLIFRGQLVDGRVVIGTKQERLGNSKKQANLGLDLQRDCEMIEVLARDLLKNKTPFITVITDIVGNKKKRIIILWEIKEAPAK